MTAIQKAKITSKKLYGPDYEGRDLRNYYVMLPAWWAEKALEDGKSHVVLLEKSNGQLEVTAVEKGYRVPK